MFTERVFAAAGTPQEPVSVKVREAPAPRAGPPRGPAALRVSRMRQGVSVKNTAPLDDVTVGVAVGVAVGRIGVGVNVRVEVTSVLVSASA